MTRMKISVLQKPTSVLTASANLYPHSRRWRPNWRPTGGGCRAASYIAMSAGSPTGPVDCGHSVGGECQIRSNEMKGVNERTYTKIAGGLRRA